MDSRNRSVQGAWNPTELAQLGARFSPMLIQQAFWNTYCVQAGVGVAEATGHTPPHLFPSSDVLKKLQNLVSRKGEFSARILLRAEGSTSQILRISSPEKSGNSVVPVHRRRGGETLYLPSSTWSLCLLDSHLLLGETTSLESLTNKAVGLTFVEFRVWVGVGVHPAAGERELQSQ